MPVCKGCGGSFDDSFRFCPYCGLAKPESEVIKVEVRVSSDDKWDTCQICRYIYHKEEHLFGDDVEEGYFWADGIGLNGTFFAGESPIFNVVYQQDKKNYKWSVIGNGSRPAHDFLVNRLIKNGWEPDGSFGEEWWQNKFRRPYGKEYPPSWTIGEIYLERSGFLDTTGYFVIQSNPSGNIKQPVKRGKSKEFKAGFENPERRQILEEFLTELQSQGYKLLSPSENKNLKDCSHFLSHQTSVWYFQILIKEKQQ
jgi:hypothetical protein